MEYSLWTDGAVTKNPGGQASYGYLLYGDNIQISFGYGVIGSGAKMNNVLAEYYAISQGLSDFLRHWNQPKSSLVIYNDSQYVVAKVLDDPIIGFQLRQLKQYLDLKIVWIPRNLNIRADDLTKRLR